MWSRGRTWRVYCFRRAKNGSATDFEQGQGAMLDVFFHLSKLLFLSNYCKYRKRAVNKNDNDNVKMAHGHTLSLNWMAISILFWRLWQEAVCFPPAALSLVVAHHTQNNGPCRGGPTGEKRVRSLRWGGEEQLSQPPQGPKYWTDRQTDYIIIYVYNKIYDRKHMHL